MLVVFCYSIFYTQILHIFIKLSFLVVYYSLQYGITAAILLLDVSTACLPEVGGSGCD